MDVLIAGGHGRIARHLIRILAADGHTARGADPQSGPRGRHRGRRRRGGGVRPRARGPGRRTSAAPTRSSSRPAPGRARAPERKRTVDLGAAVKCIEAAEALGVARFLIVSSIGAQDPDGGVEAMRPYLRAKAEADARLAASGAGLDDRAARQPRRTTRAPGWSTSRPSSAAAVRCRARTSRACWRRSWRRRRRRPPDGRAVRRRRARRGRRPRTGINPCPLASDLVMRRIVERHLAKLRRAQQAPEELDRLQHQLVARLYPAGGGRAAPRPARSASPRMRPTGTSRRSCSARASGR